MDKVRDYEYRGINTEIFCDDSIEDPREIMDNFGKMICFHKRYNLGDKHNYSDDEYFLEEITGMDLCINSLEAMLNKFNRENIALPLFLYDHSGITISTSTYSCPWDSGRVGVIYKPKNEVRKVYNVKRISEKLRQEVLDILQSEVKIYDDYLTGNCYGYMIEKTGDSVWGFYGDIDDNGIIESIQDSIDCYISKEYELFEHAGVAI